MLESVQYMLLKVALQTARDDYETRRERQRQGVELAKASGKYKGRRPEPKTHERIIALRESGMTIARTATLAGCSVSQVKRIWALYNTGQKTCRANEYAEIRMTYAAQEN